MPDACRLAGSTGSRVHVYRWVWKGDDKLPTITDDFFKQACRHTRLMGRLRSPPAS